MIAVGAIYMAYLAASGRWKTFVPNAASWKDSLAARRCRLCRAGRDSSGIRVSAGGLRSGG